MRQKYDQTDYKTRKTARDRFVERTHQHGRPSAAVSALSVRSRGVFHAGRHAEPAQRFRTARLQFRCRAHLQLDERQPAELPWPLWGYVPDYDHPLHALVCTSRFICHQA